MTLPLSGANPDNRPWLETRTHRDYLLADAQRQFDFFRASIRPEGGFYSLDSSGNPLPDTVQELHSTTRMVHSYALGKLAGFGDCDEMIDQGIRYLKTNHHDREHGGYFWGVDGAKATDSRKLAYGHVFVLLAAASAHSAGHLDAQALLDDVDAVLNEHFWEEEHGLFCDEWNQDWTPFSTYRGMNANMHGTEALLTAFEVTGREIYLERAGRILDFFVGKIAPANSWRLVEHYNADWTPDRAYSENPMFRPAGTTPGHSLELARLLLQYWDLSGRPNTDAPTAARRLAETALADAWDQESGGLYYTLNFDGTPLIKPRYWWPVTEAIGVVATLLKLEGTAQDEEWYRKLWTFADAHFVDHIHGGWFPEIDDQGKPTETQFRGKPDIYHALQAVLFPLTSGISNMGEGVKGLRG
ncbi:AGE family epimerase/isomerase [Falsihalocynthiibacter sp. SS001]|uniref:AGE family epimerase/isomerase n=1 Tax=Falsihalocynthiibacter sp. SS001 TaxID=3349698 RepID=UPI0036D3C1E9